MENQIAVAGYRDFFASKQSFHLPRWEELPDIELYMDQVITLMNKYMEFFAQTGESTLTPSMINNYVKHGIIPCPVKKKYSRVHLARLVIICVMKPVLPISSIGGLINSLLETRSEAEVLNFFSDHYEHTFSNIIEILKGYARDVTANETDINTMLSLTVMHAAAISGGGKFLAQSALSEIEKC